MFNILEFFFLIRDSFTRAKSIMELINAANASMKRDNIMCICAIGSLHSPPHLKFYLSYIVSTLSNNKCLCFVGLIWCGGTTVCNYSVGSNYNEI